MNIDWSKAPEGATHWEPQNGGVLASWMKNEDGKWFFWNPHASIPYWVESFARMGKRVSLMIKRPCSEWSGQGLPPVGTVCEVDYCEQWHQCEVIAHFQQRCGMVAAFTVLRNTGAKSLDAFGESAFRPIRTPEQIAAEERDKAILNACEVIKQAHYQMPSTEVAPVEKAKAYAAALYDAGYRKQEQPK